MVKRYATVKSGVVTNVILATEAVVGHVTPRGERAVLLHDDSPVSIGWGHDGAGWSPPVAEHDTEAVTEPDPVAVPAGRSVVAVAAVAAAVAAAVTALASWLL